MCLQECNEAMNKQKHHILGHKGPKSFGNDRTNDYRIGPIKAFPEPLPVGWLPGGKIYDFIENIVQYAGITKFVNNTPDAVFIFPEVIFGGADKFREINILWKAAKCPKRIDSI